MADSISNPRLALYLDTIRALSKDLANGLEDILTPEVTSKLANSLLDGTLFEIIKELEEIQALQEQRLLQERMKLANTHKKKITDLKLQAKHNLNTANNTQDADRINQNYNQDILLLEKTCEEEMRSRDQFIILQIDELVADQQSILEQASAPFFFVTNDPEEIKVQICFLQMLQQLSVELGTSN